MTKDEALKMAQDLCPYFHEISKGAFYDGFITALDQLPDNTKMMGLIPSEWAGLEEPPNSTTDVVESTDSLSTLVWRDLKTDRQRADWLRLGMGYQTGVVAAAIQQELAMAYERLVGFQKIHAALAPPQREWVGLTDEEIEKLGDKHLVSVQEYIGSGDYVSHFEGETDFARAIEAKLKEKNG